MTGPQHTLFIYNSESIYAQIPANPYTLANAEKRAHKTIAHTRDRTGVIGYRVGIIDRRSEDVFSTKKRAKTYCPLKVVGEAEINLPKVKIYRVPGPGPSTGGRRLFFEKKGGADFFY